MTTNTPYRWDEAAVKDLADRMQRQLEKLDVDSSGAAPVDGDRRMMDPNQHFLQNSLDAIFLIPGVIGGLVLVLGLLLVYNTITAIVGQQVTQIGVMKAIGASMGQILLIFFSGVLIYGVLVVLVPILPERRLLCARPSARMAWAAVAKVKRLSRLVLLTRGT